MEAQQSIIKTIKVKKEGFKWGQELLKAKAIIAALKEEVECYTKQINSQYKLYDIETKILKERNQELAQENENRKSEIAGDNDRMDKMQKEFRKTMLKFQAEIDLLVEIDLLKRQRNQELETENENLKVELAGDDARMDKMQQESRKTILKLQAEIDLLKRQRPSSP